MDRGQLPKMAAKAKEALGFEQIEAIADAGYYRGSDLIACRDNGRFPVDPHRTPVRKEYRVRSRSATMLVSLSFITPLSFLAYDLARADTI